MKNLKELLSNRTYNSVMDYFNNSGHEIEIIVGPDGIDPHTLKQIRMTDFAKMRNVGKIQINEVRTALKFIDEKKVKMPLTRTISDKITIRDQFAMAALSGGKSPQEAYEIADGMIKQRQR